MGNRIFFFTDDPGIGGVAQYNQMMTIALASAGYQVRPFIAIPENLFALVDEVKSQVVQLPGAVLTRFSEIPELLGEKPDLVICSNSSPISNLHVKRVAVHLGLPLLIVEHFVDPTVAEEHAQHLEELHQHYCYANQVVAVSQENLDLLHQRFGLEPSKGRVIHYGRPDSYFTPIDPEIRDRLRQALGIPPEGVLCFTAARIEPRKGYHYQLEAIKQLKDHPAWNHLYFAWAGSPNFEPWLVQSLQEELGPLGGMERVFFLGHRPDVVDWLNAADIFVFPSEMEGMPLCVMEAMAKGLPVVASAVSGIPEELGDTGQLLADPKQDPVATVDQLVQTLIAWSEDSEVRQEVGRSCYHRASQMFRQQRMIQETLQVIESIHFPSKDYVSPGLALVRPDAAFPNMIVGNTDSSDWPYLRRHVPHNWYVDYRQPTIGFVSRDEAHILYNSARQFQGKRALEIGCWLGWSACHLALAGVQLDVIDPLLGQADVYESVSSSLKAAGVWHQINLVPGYSPYAVVNLAEQTQRRWSLLFIDGNHDAPAPLEDAIACLPLAEPDALVLFHDLASPEVAQGLDYFRDQGWQTMVYQTMQVMGVAWRGNVTPVQHQPDPQVNWELPAHLQGYQISGVDLGTPVVDQEFEEILSAIVPGDRAPYTMLSRERLFSLYNLAKRVCVEDIPGNFVECGSFKGGSAVLLATVIKNHSRRPRQLYACDTFDQMPAPTLADQTDGVDLEAAGYGSVILTAPISHLQELSQEMGVADLIVPVPGLFAETLPQHCAEMGQIAFLHADGDWYESTRDIFQNLYDQLAANALVQIDDYGYWEGCRKAVHEFEQARGEILQLNKVDASGVWFRRQTMAVREQAQELVQRSLQLLQTNQLAEAMRLAEQAVALAPALPGANYVLCTCYKTVGRHREALEAIKAELAINPAHVQAQQELESLTRLHSRPQARIPSAQRPWHTGLPTEMLHSIQNATHNYTYRGVPMIKNPFDFALYPLLLWSVKPRTIIEIGSKDGGSALWLGDMTQNFGLDTHIYSIDVVQVTAVNHPRVTFMEGDGRALEKTLSTEFLQTLPRPWLIIEDADHLYETSIKVLEFFHPYLQSGEYIVVEDGIISDLVRDESYNSGPHQAMKEFLARHGREYEIDSTYCDFFGYNLTWCTNGFLKKVQQGQGDAVMLTAPSQRRSPTIVVDAVFFQLYKTGIARVWRSLLETWSKSDFAAHIVVMDRANTAPRFPGLRYVTIPPYNYATTDKDRDLLQRVCDDEGADLFISTYYTTPTTTPSVFMAYDMIPEVMGANFDEPMWREKHYGIEHASAFITISENTAKDLVQFFPSIGADQVTVAHCGVSPVFQPATESEIQQFKRKHGITRPYFMLAALGVGYKNSALFFQAFAQMVSQQGFEIVCTGVTSQYKDEFTANLETTVHALQLSDAELRLAYAGAVALVYPSKYEGFGLPLAEALASGCPVITCPNASIPEVAGDAAIYVSDSDAEALAEALCEVQKPAVRRRMVAAGLAQAQKFSWDTMADKTATALLEATLLPLKLNEINLLIAPDWAQPEADLSEALAQTLRAIATHPDRDRMTLLVTSGTASEEEANLLLSGVAMNLLLEEELDVSDGLEISLLPSLGDRQWELLRPRIQVRLVLEREDAEAIAAAKLETVPSQPLESFKLLADT